MQTSRLVSTAITPITRSACNFQRRSSSISWILQGPKTIFNGSSGSLQSTPLIQRALIASSTQKTSRESNDSVNLQSAQPQHLDEFITEEQKELKYDRWRPSTLRKRRRRTPLRTYTLPDVGLTSAQLAVLADVSSHTILNCAKQLDGNMCDEGSVLSPAVVELVVEELGLHVAFNPQTEPLLPVSAKPSSSTATRAPVITVMGHVDHGKTSLLDALRNTDVAKHEAGGITQSVAAFRVPIRSKDSDSGWATFIDTPGHAAFSAMRANGAVATDIIVLVVAADDGVKPQTIEAARLSRTCNTAIIVAINKCDKPSADPDRVRYQLLQDADINTETLGGTVQSIEISAKTGSGLPELLDAISIQAEMLELKCDDQEAGRGICLESRVDRSFGNVATVVVRSGKIQKGDFVAFHSGILLQGEPYGRVRLLMTSAGEHVSEAGPGTAIGIIGIKHTVPPGCEIAVMKNERLARSKAQGIIKRNIEAVGTIELANRLIAEREELESQSKERPGAAGLEASPGKNEENENEEKDVPQKSRQLVLVVKADVKGSADAVAQCVQRLGDENIGIRVVSMGVGEVTDTDIQTASVGKKVKDSNDKCMIIAFNVRVRDSIQKAGRVAGVEIVQDKIIYRLEDQVRSVVEDIRAKMTKQEHIVGKADVMRVFDSGAIAGCRVGDGSISIGSMVKVMRLPEDWEQVPIRQEIYRGEISSIKQYANTVKSVNKGSECGIGIKGWSSFKNGDQILAINITGGI